MITQCPPPPQVTLPPQLTEGVISATRSTLRSILGSEPTLLKTDEPITVLPVVVGLISFMGDHSWSVAYILPKRTATDLALKFVGFDIAFESPDMADAVGELANVIAGDIVANLDRMRIKAFMSLPSVSRGDHVEMLVPAGMPTVRLAFNSSHGQFWCQVIWAPQSKMGARRPGT